MIVCPSGSGRPPKKRKAESSLNHGDGLQRPWLWLWKLRPPGENTWALYVLGKSISDLCDTYTSVVFTFPSMFLNNPYNPI